MLDLGPQTSCLLCLLLFTLKKKKKDRAIKDRSRITIVEGDRFNTLLIINMASLLINIIVKFPADHVLEKCFSLHIRIR